MNYKKACCALAILFSLLESTRTRPMTYLIGCEADRANQIFACLDAAVAKVKNDTGNQFYVVGYGNSDRVSCEGWHLAAAFRRQLIDTIRKQGGNLAEAQVRAVDGGYRDDAQVEVYAGGANQQPPVTAKWPAACRYR